MLQVMEKLLVPSPFTHVEFVLSRATPHPSNVMSVQSGLITFAASPYVAFYFFYYLLQADNLVFKNKTLGCKNWILQMFNYRKSPGGFLLSPALVFNGKLQ